MTLDIQQASSSAGTGAKALATAALVANTVLFGRLLRRAGKLLPVLPSRLHRLGRR